MSNRRRIGQDEICGIQFLQYIIKQVSQLWIITCDKHRLYIRTKNHRPNKRSSLRRDITLISIFLVFYWLGILNTQIAFAKSESSLLLFQWFKSLTMPWLKSLVSMYAYAPSADKFSAYMNSWKSFPLCWVPQLVYTAALPSRVFVVTVSPSCLVVNPSQIWPVGCRAA